MHNLQSNQNRLTCFLFKNIESFKCKRFVKHTFLSYFFHHEDGFLRLKRLHASQLNQM